LAAIGLYALVCAESRYVAPFVLLLWAGPLAHVRLPAGEWPRRALAAGGSLMGLFVWVNLAALNLEGLGGLIGYASQRHGEQATSLTRRSLGDCGRADHPPIAEALRANFGLEPGAPVTFIGYSYSAYWAKLGRYRIIAEVRPEEFEGFWTQATTFEKRCLRHSIRSARLR